MGVGVSGKKVVAAIAAAGATAFFSSAHAAVLAVEDVGPLNAASASSSHQLFAQADVISTAGIGGTMLAGAQTLTPPDVTQLALDYLEGGPAPVMAQLEKQIIDQGTEIALDLLDFGVSSLGIPGAAPMVKSLIGLFSGGGGAAGGPNFALEIAELKGRVTAVESAVKKINHRLNENAIKDARDSNIARTARVLDKMDVMEMRANDLTMASEMTTKGKIAFLKNIMVTLDSFLPENEVQETIWLWDNIILRPNKTLGEVELARAEKPGIDLALEPYLRSLALFVSAKNQLAVTLDEDLWRRMRKHAAFLNGDEAAREAAGLPFSLIDRHFPVKCGLRNVTTSSCTATAYCENAVATKEQTALGAKMSAGFCDFYDDDPDYFTFLEQEVLNEPNPVTDLINAAAKALSGAAAPQTPLAGSERELLQNNVLYGVAANGDLSSFDHSIWKYDTWKAKDKPAPSCADPAYRESVDCQPPVSAIDCSKPSGRYAEECQPDYKPKAPDANLPVARYDIRHELRRAGDIKGDWKRFRQTIFAGGVRGGVVVYGLQADGVLVAHLIAGGKVTASKAVGHGWNTFTHLFSGGDGIVYAVAQNGDLVWYKHSNYGEVNGFPTFEKRVVGIGWNGFTKIFSSGKGFIYAVKPDGTLWWYKHNGFLTGAGLGENNSWEQPRQVGEGWTMFARIAAAPNGHIYGVDGSGNLLFYHHTGWATGESQWLPAVTLATDWSKFSDCFAAVYEGGGGDPK